MKKVLLLAYDFPPYVSVGGLRPYNWYKYFKEFGVEPIVITRQWDNEYGNELDYIAPSKSKKTIIEKSDFGTIYRSPYKANLSNRLLLKHGEGKFKVIRKLITAYYEFAQFLYITGPKKELYKTAKAYLKENKVDAIIATGEPFILFSYASNLSKEFDIPWIADYRDPWSQNKNRSSNLLLKVWNNYFEKRIVARSKCVTTVSTFFQKQIEENVKNKTIHILPNGYDNELVGEASLIKQSNDTLRIAFVGTIYNWHPWKLFIAHYCKFINSYPHIRIILNFYGINSMEEVQAYISDNYPDLINHFDFIPRLPNNEILVELAKNNVMLLFNYYSFMGTKIYDYLGVNRKILFCFSSDKEANNLKDKFYHLVEDVDFNSLQADLIKETNSGVIVKDSTHLGKVLEELWREFREKGKIECNSVGVEKYSRKEQVEELARIIRGLG